MMNFKNEEAVSPVIGVILMVAITVILAAVIAAFVLEMGDNLPENKDVYVTTKLGVIPGDDSGKRVMIVTIQGGKDVSSLEAVKYSGVESDGDGGSTFAKLKPFGRDGTDGTETWDAPYEIGSSGYIDLRDATGTKNIIIRGEFADGSVTILANNDYVGGTSSQDDGES